MITKEEKKSLQDELDNLNKGLNSLDWQYKFWQRKASVDSRDQVMAMFRNVTGQRNTSLEYKKFLEDKLKEE